MTDYHCHLLPGIDDGPSTLSESLEMAKILSSVGFRKVYCTPHMIKNVYDADNNTVLNLICYLQNELNNRNIKLQLLSGREYCLHHHLIENSHNLMPLQGTKYVLVEIPGHTPKILIIEMISALIDKGYIPMIAHPERSHIFRDNHDNCITKKIKDLIFRNSVKNTNNEFSYHEFNLLDWLMNIGCAFQSSLGNLIGYYGKSSLDSFIQFRNQGIYTHSGTDAHSPEFLLKLVKQAKTGIIETLTVSSENNNHHLISLNPY